MRPVIALTSYTAVAYGTNSHKKFRCISKHVQNVIVKLRSMFDPAWYLLHFILCQ